MMLATKFILALALVQAVACREQQGLRAAAAATGDDDFCVRKALAWYDLNTAEITKQEKDGKDVAECRKQKKDANPDIHCFRALSHWVQKEAGAGALCSCKAEKCEKKTAGVVDDCSDGTGYKWTGTCRRD